eukprot:623899-Hanusia_phi.AAC.1
MSGSIPARPIRPKTPQRREAPARKTSTESTACQLDFTLVLFLRSLSSTSPPPPLSMNIPAATQLLRPRPPPPPHQHHPPFLNSPLPTPLPSSPLLSSPLLSSPLLLNLYPAISLVFLLPPCAGCSSSIPILFLSAASSPPALNDSLLLVTCSEQSGFAASTPWLPFSKTLLDSMMARKPAPRKMPCSRQRQNTDRRMVTSPP